MIDVYLNIYMWYMRLCCECFDYLIAVHGDTNQQYYRHGVIHNLKSTTTNSVSKDPRRNWLYILGVVTMRFTHKPMMCWESSRLEQLSPAGVEVGPVDDEDAEEPSAILGILII